MVYCTFFVSQVPQQTKLPSLYLLDSIVKNVGGEYLHLVAQIMEKSFTCVFEKVQCTMIILKTDTVHSLRVEGRNSLFSYLKGIKLMLSQLTNHPLTY